MLIKKIIFSAFSLLIFTSSVQFSYGLDISAECAVVINAETKEIIYQKNAFRKHSMASTTKIMTSILAVESGEMSDRVTVTQDALTEGSSIGLKSGCILTLESLVYGMMLESGNDAANACALYLADDYESFSYMMNLKADEIGMTDTNFVTPSGLDDTTHYSTAYDMALLGAYSISNPIFREICSEKIHNIRLIKPDIEVTFSNHNKLLGSCEGVFGIKTGFTKKSGRCLVSACERDGATLVCVTLNAGDDWNDHRKLYDEAFSELNKVTFKFSDFSRVRVYGSDDDSVGVYCDEYTLHYIEDSDVTEQVIMPEIIYAPIKSDEIIGKVNYYSGENLIHTSYIYSADDIPASEETYKEENSLFDLIRNIFIN